MSYCPSCGANVGEYAFCTHCGYAVSGKPPVYVQPVVQYVVKPVTPDAPSKGIAWISFFFPLVGLILYLVYHDTKPLKAASAGKGALWGILTPLIVVLVATLVLMIFTLFRFRTLAKIKRSELQKMESRISKTAYSISTSTYWVSDVLVGHHEIIFKT